MVGERGGRGPLTTSALKGNQTGWNPTIPSEDTDNLKASLPDSATGWTPTLPEADPGRNKRDL